MLELDAEVVVRGDGFAGSRRRREVAGVDRAILQRAQREVVTNTNAGHHIRAAISLRIAGGRTQKNETTNQREPSKTLSSHHCSSLRCLSRNDATRRPQWQQISRRCLPRRRALPTIRGPCAIPTKQPVVRSKRAVRRGGLSWREALPTCGCRDPSRAPSARASYRPSR